MMQKWGKIENEMNAGAGLLFSYQIKLFLLTASDKIVTKNAQAAKNHCTLQIAIDDSSNPASNTTTEVGIKILDTNISANATLTINALPEKISWTRFLCK